MLFSTFDLCPVSENPSTCLKEHLKISEVAKFESDLLMLKTMRV